jgi:hypothetical protein
MQSEDARELDALLEAGLASYSSAEPQLGMEERVVRAALAQKTPRKVRWAWAAAALASACVLLAMVLTLNHLTTAHAPSLVQTHPAAQGAGQANSLGIETAVVRNEARAPVKHRTGMGASRARINTQQTESKDDIFPAPQVLTAEEADVVAAVEIRPAEISQALKEAQARSLEPVRVAAIHIEPLRQDGVRQEE